MIISFISAVIYWLFSPAMTKIAKKIYIMLLVPMALYEFIFIVHEWMIHS